MKLDENIKREVAILWNKGTKVKDIVKLLGVSRSSIVRCINQSGFRDIKKAIRLDSKDEAIKLRESGFSALEISKKIGVPKGTVGHWIEGILLSEEQKNRLDNKRLEKSREGCLKGSTINKQRSDERHKLEREKGFIKAKDDKVFSVICALYWGEGGKTRRCFTFANSDLSMLVVVAKWLISNGYEYKIDIVHHEDGTDEESIREYWRINLPGAKSENISKVRWKKSTGEIKRKMVMGCVHLVVNNALLHSLIMGGIDYLSEG